MARLLEDSATRDEAELVSLRAVVAQHSGGWSTLSSSSIHRPDHAFGNDSDAKALERIAAIDTTASVSSSRPGITRSSNEDTSIVERGQQLRLPPTPQSEPVSIAQTNEGIEFDFTRKSSICSAASLGSDEYNYGRRMSMASSVASEDLLDLTTDQHLHRMERHAAKIKGGEKGRSPSKRGKKVEKKLKMMMRAEAANLAAMMAANHPNHHEL
eukprot:SAG31_NODE_271_length_18717_cov_8.685949_16_plen_213_part_00